MTDLDNWPRIIQFAFCVYDEKKQLIAEHCALIKPDGWTIPNEKFWIDNGFSQSRSEEFGLPIHCSLRDFISWINKSKYLIAHNIKFDYPITGAEMIRAKMKADVKLKQICTMDAGTDLCQLPGRYGFKWPKLEELHKHLFGIGFEGAHDALNDVKACAKCFFELTDRGIVKLN